MLAASLMSLLGGGWLLKGQDNFGLFIVAAAFIYGYMLVALVLVERGRLEKARDSYRLELDEAVKDQEKVRAADSGGSPEGDVAVP